jgi:hypothetical protein
MTPPAISIEDALSLRERDVLALADELDQLADWLADEDVVALRTMIGNLFSVAGHEGAFAIQRQALRATLASVRSRVA